MQLSKIIITLTFISVSTMGMTYADALSELESGNNDSAKGKHGEVSRYQILPSIWKQYAPLSQATSKDVAYTVMARIWWPRILQFQKRENRQATAREMYLLWNCPAHVLKPSRVEIARAKRFENLVNGGTGE